MLWLIAVCILLCLLCLFLFAPGRASRELRKPFEGRAFAHRGLYSSDQSVPENSLAAFRLAAEAGYGAELDVQLTRDGEVVVMHDDDLRRACGQEGRICDYSLAELQAFRLFGTGERIPLFSEVLEIFGGKQPLIVELKTVPEKEKLCEAVCRMLADYNGPACIESFHPFIVRWFRRNDPSRLRGQLSQAARDWKGYVPAWLAFLLSRLFLNFASRPMFIAWGIGPKPLSVRLCEAMGAMKVCWTAREESLHRARMSENDAVIFEAYRPDP